MTNYRKTDLPDNLTLDKIKPKVKIKDIFEELNENGIGKNLLPAGPVKNSKRIRFETRIISLEEDEQPI